MQLFVPSFQPHKFFNCKKPIIDNQVNKNKTFLTCLNAQYKYNIFQDGSDRAKRLVSSEERYAIIQKPLGIVL